MHVNNIGNKKNYKLLQCKYKINNRPNFRFKIKSESLRTGSCRRCM